MSVRPPVLALGLAAAFSMAPARLPAQAAPEAAGQAVPAGDRPADGDSVRRLLALTDAAGTGERVFRATLTAMSQAMPQVPQAFWEGVREETDWADFTERLVPVYRQTFTQAEVEGLIAFYESPLGRRFAAAQPTLAQASVEAGEQWAEEILQAVLRRLQAEAE